MSQSAACTVVIPCFDGECYLESAFQSVMNQSFEDFHLVLVDDASRDQTLSLAQKLAEPYPNVSVVSIPENRGRCHARNLGTRINKSPFLAFLDQDDSYHPDFLRAAIQTLRQHPEIDAARVRPMINIQLDPLYEHSVSVSLANTMVFRRTAFEFVGGWPESEVFRRLALGGEDIALRTLFTMLFREGVLDAKFYNYSHRPGNALDLLLSRSEIVNGKIVAHSHREEDRILREEIQRLNREFAGKIRQFIYRHFRDESNRLADS